MFEDLTGHMQVGTLEPAAEIVDLTCGALFEDGQNPSTEVLHPEPITDVESVAVQGYVFSIQRSADHLGNQFLHMLPNSVVV